MLQLVAAGKVRLDDSVERWLPGLVPNGAAITIQDLLDHTSGLFNYTDDSDFDQAVVADPARTWSPRELVAFATAHPPLFPPGTGWFYSNTNYVLLGLVVEAASGTTLEQQLRERIFQPRALEATSFPSGTLIDGEYAHGYVGPATLPVPPGTLLDVGETRSRAACRSLFVASCTTRRSYCIHFGVCEGWPLPASRRAPSSGACTADEDVGSAVGDEDVFAAVVVERLSVEATEESLELEPRYIEEPEPFVLGCPPQ